MTEKEMSRKIKGPAREFFNWMGANVLFHILTSNESCKQPLARLITMRDFYLAKQDNPHITIQRKNGSFYIRDRRRASDLQDNRRSVQKGNATVSLRSKNQTGKPRLCH